MYHDLGEEDGGKEKKKKKTLSKENFVGLFGDTFSTTHIQFISSCRKAFFQRRESSYDD